MAWAVFRDDGEIVSGCAPGAVSPFGVVVIAQPDYHGGRQLMHGWNFYRWDAEDGRWWGMDYEGLLQRLLRRQPVEALCLGASIASPAFQSMMAAAAEYEMPGLPLRAGPVPGERP